MDLERVYQKAYELRCEGRYDEALREFERVLSLSPIHANARWQVGLVQGFLGDYEASVKTLTGVVQDDPRHEKALYDLAMTELMIGLDVESKRHFDQLRRIQEGR